MDFVRTQDFIDFHEMMIMDTNYDVSWFFEPTPYVQCGLHDWSLISTITFESFKILV
jgi:hypothetical protein